MESGSSSMSRSRTQGKKTDKTRRVWTQREEEVLIGFLKDLVASGWKGDNGFKVGYLGILEQNMKTAFPGAGIRGLPHINSKLHVWKKNYSSLVTALSRSGVGWTETTKMLDCNDETWDVVVKNDPNARGMRYKSWPYFDDWREIFGKDRATGEHAEDVMDAVNELVSNENLARNASLPTDVDFNINLDDILEDTATNSVCQDKQGEPSGKKAKKKRKFDDGNEGLYELLGQLCRTTDEKLDEIARRIGYEYDVGERRKQCYDLLGKMNGLTIDDKLNVSKLLVKNIEYLEMFLGLPEEARSRFVMQLLRGEL